MSALPEYTSSTQYLTALVRDTKLCAELWEIFSVVDFVFSAAETWSDPSTDSRVSLHPGNRCPKGHALGCETLESGHTSSGAVSRPRGRREVTLCHLLNTCLSPSPAQRQDGQCLSSQHRADAQFEEQRATTGIHSTQALERVGRREASRALHRRGYFGGNLAISKDISNGSAGHKESLPA